MPILNMIYWATWGGGWGWQLWANTIAYYPLNWDILDHKWDYGITWTMYDLSLQTWTIAYTSSFESWKQAFHSQATSSTTGWCAVKNQNSIWNFSGDFTVTYCFRKDANYNKDMWFIYNRNDHSWWIGWQSATNWSNYLWFHWSTNYVTTFQPTIWTWYNVTCTVVSWTYHIYVNGTEIKTGSFSRWTNPWCLTLWWYINWTGSDVDEQLNWCLCEIIIDWEWWDATKALERARYLWFA
jgi:hypothetical protein